MRSGVFDSHHVASDYAETAQTWKGMPREAGAAQTDELLTVPNGLAASTASATDGRLNAKRVARRLFEAGLTNSAARARHARTTTSQLHEARRGAVEFEAKGQRAGNTQPSPPLAPLRPIWLSDSGDRREAVLSHARAVACPVGREVAQR